jgi:hypothetical protein
MAWRPISEAPGKHPIVIRDKRDCLPGGVIKSRVGMLISGGRCILYSATRVAEPKEVARLEWNDLGKTIEGPTLRCSKPYTFCDTAGPVYSPEWFSEDCNLRPDISGPIKGRSYEAGIIDDTMIQQPGAAGDYPIDYVPPGLNLGAMLPTTATIVSTEKRGRGRPAGSKGKPTECVKYFKGLVGEMRNKGISYQAVEIALREGKHPYPVPCLSTISRYGSEIEKESGVKFNVVRPSQFCRKEAWAYYNPLIIEMLDAGCSTSEIFLKLREGKHPHKVPGRSTIANWVNARKQQAAKANEPTITGEVKYAGGLFGMADNSPRGAESEVGIGE